MNSTTQEFGNARAAQLCYSLPAPACGVPVDCLRGAPGRVGSELRLESPAIRRGPVPRAATVPRSSVPSHWTIPASLPEVAVSAAQLVRSAGTRRARAQAADRVPQPSIAQREHD